MHDELLQRLADLRASGPAGCLLRQRAHGLRRAPPTKHRSDLGELRAEEKSVHALEVALQGISEAQKKQAVRIHGAANVQQHHQTVLLDLSCLVAEIDQVTPAADVAAYGPAQVYLAALSDALETAGEAQAHLPQQPDGKALQLRQIVL